jgi:hypothetical protein
MCKRWRAKDGGLKKPSKALKTGASSSSRRKLSSDGISSALSFTGALESESNSTVFIVIVFQSRSPTKDKKERK